MNTLEVGKKLVELCNQGKQFQVMETLYSQDIVSVEAQTMPGMEATTHGLQGVIAKSKWWVDNHEVHSSVTEGPWPNGDRFIVKFKFDVTNKPSGKRFVMEETGLYTVQNGKIVREEFFYPGM
jgi:hypothetical protein